MTFGTRTISATDSPDAKYLNAYIFCGHLFYIPILMLLAAFPLLFLGKGDIAILLIPGAGGGWLLITLIRSLLEKPAKDQHEQVVAAAFKELVRKSN